MLLLIISELRRKESIDVFQCKYIIQEAMKLKDYVKVTYNKEYIYIFYRDGLRIEKNEENIRLINELIIGRPQDVLVNENPNYLAILQKLNEHNFITEFDFDKYSNTKEERLLYYLDQYKDSPQKLYNRLQNAKVCIVGLGGLGGNILQMLLSSGIRNFVLVDFDRVEYGNLNRQYMYNIKDIGRLKTELCKEKALEFDSAVRCKVYNKKIKEENDLLEILSDFQPDVLVSAADTPNNIRTKLYNVAKMKSCAYVEGGLGIDYGRYLFLEPQQFDKMSSLGVEQRYDLLNQVVPKGSFGPTNSIICGFIALDIVNYLINKTTWSNGNRVVIDFNEKKINTMLLEK